MRVLPRSFVAQAYTLREPSKAKNDGRLPMTDHNAVSSKGR
jgi:hypothetical protein